MTSQEEECIESRGYGTGGPYGDTDQCNYLLKVDYIQSISQDILDIYRFSLDFPNALSRNGQCPTS